MVAGPQNLSQRMLSLLLLAAPTMNLPEMSDALWWRKNRGWRTALSLLCVCVCVRACVRVCVCVCVCVCVYAGTVISEHQCCWNLNNSSSCCFGILQSLSVWLETVDTHAHTHYSQRKKMAVAAVFLLRHIRRAWWKAFCIRALCNQSNSSTTRYSPPASPRLSRTHPAPNIQTNTSCCLCATSLLRSYFIYWLCSLCTRRYPICLLHFNARTIHVLMNVDASWNARCVDIIHWCRRICWILCILGLIGSFYLRMLSDLLQEIFHCCSLWQWGPKGWTGRGVMGRSLVQFHDIPDESGMSRACTSTWAA